MSSVVTIRRAQVADLQTVLSLVHSAQEAPNWTDAHYAELLTAAAYATPLRTLLLAHKDTEPAGFCVMSVAVDEGELENIVVASNSRRLGVGKMLLREGLAWAESEGAKKIWLEVRESNAAALALYQSLGFEATGRRRSYYNDPTEDAVLMRAALGIATHLQ